ncbi:MAG: cytochrome c biogenesis heme-transporting ATPase CcmA [Rubrivivax sp.]
MTALLSARALSARRGDRLLFSGLELDLQAGEVVWLRGTNGRGKTTLLRLLAGLATPERGEVRFESLPLRQAGAAWREHLAYVAHSNALKDDLSAAQALAFLAGLRGRPVPPEAVDAALARLGVQRQARLPVRALSQGQRRRVALARLALSEPPRVWLLDEPFDALDEGGIETLAALLREHAARGGTALLTSHQALPTGLASRTLDLDALGGAARGTGTEARAGTNPATGAQA